jgi:hypothetical protein
MAALRYVLVYVAMCCGFISTLGQSQPPQLYPIPVHGKWGYIDRNGSVRIPLRFDWASAFREGLAVVEVDAKYGFIDSNGIAVMQPTFYDAFPFSEGLAGACAGEHCGFVDHSGKFVVSPQFGTKITHPGLRAFSEGLAAVFTNGKWGYIDKAGKLVIPPKYDFAEGFSDGLAAVGVAGNPPTFGFIDHNGQVAIALHYHTAAPFHEGVAIVREHELIGKWYGTSVIDRTGRRVYGPVTEAINEYHQGVASTYSLDGSALGFIDRQGKHVLKTTFAGVDTYFSEGLAAVSSPDGKSGGYINKTGNLVIKGSFSMACPFSKGLAFIHTAQWAGYIDTTGQFVWKTPVASLGDAQIESCTDY